MSRAVLALFLVGLMAPVQADPEPAEKKLRLRARLRSGARYTGSNTVSYTVRTTVRQGDAEHGSTISVQRTERFLDAVVRAGVNGITEIRRNYLRLYTKSRDAENGRPTVNQSPMQGRTVVIRENRRRRDVALEGRGVLDPMVRRTVGMEMDWRDLFPEEPVGPGDTWNADATALARRLAAYLDCGTRTRMRVRYEENLVREGARQAKFYVDWTVEGMRDRRLYTKVILAGDVYYDFRMRRIVTVDLGGSMIVRGAVMTDGSPRIVKGEGPVTLKTVVNEAPVQAAAPGQD